MKKNQRRLILRDALRLASDPTVCTEIFKDLVAVNSSLWVEKSVRDVRRSLTGLLKVLEDPLHLYVKSGGLFVEVDVDSGEETGISFGVKKDWYGGEL